MRFDFRRLIYAAGNFGKNILWGTAEITLLFMLTDMIGISPAVSGLILLTSLALDAMLGPIIGRFSDRLRTPLGRYGPLILIGAPFSALSFAALYALPILGVSNVWIVASFIMAFRVSYAFIDLPHNALIVQVTGDSRARARLAGYRFGFSSLASLTLALALAPIAETESQALSASKLAIFAAVVSVLAVIVMIAAWWVVRSSDTAAARAATSREPFNVALAALYSSPPYRIVFLAGCIATLTLPLFSKSLLFITAHILGEPSAMSQVLTAMVVGQFVGLPLWIALPSRLEKASSLQLAHAISAVGLMTLASSLFLLPIAILPASLLMGIGAGGVYTIIWAMVADCVEDVAARTAIRPEGLVFALPIFGQKAAMALGVGIYGVALGRAGYDPVEAIAPGAIAVILAFAFLFPILGSVGAIFLLSGYKLTHKDHAALIPVMSAEPALEAAEQGR